MYNKLVPYKASDSQSCGKNEAPDLERMIRIMKNTMKRVLTICLLAAMAVSAFGCGKGKNQDIPVETISLDQTKQELTFDFNAGTVDEPDDPGQDAVENTEITAEETTAAETTAAGTAAFEEVTQVVNVTDAEGHGVTDAAGESVTEMSVVATRPIETEATQASETKEGETEDPSDTTELIETRDNGPDTTTAPAEGTTEAAYKPSYATCKAYWLDMSKQGDFTFNGEFLTVTFAVKQDIPNGSYPVKLSKTDIASWEEVRYYPEIINGEVAVGQKAERQESMSDKDFSLKVNSVEAKQGETVTLTIDLANNPGFCGFVIDIQYDANAMTILEAGGGKDYDTAVNLT